MINTGVSSSLARPQTFHVFTYQFAARSLVPLPIRVGLIGMMSAAGTAVPGVIYEISDATQTDALFGIGSELALMCRIAFLTGAQLGKGPRLFACAIAEPGAGTANVQTITLTGASTSDTNLPVTVAGRTFYVGIRSGDAPAAAATAIANQLKTKIETLPVDVAVAGGVVTLTHRTKGSNGGDVVVTVDGAAPGLNFVVATGAAGAGVADPQPAIDAFSAVPMDGLAFGNHQAADIVEVNTDIAVRWSYAEKRFRFYFFGERGSIATAAALAAAANHQAVTVASFEGCLSTCGEIATAIMIATFSRERPNANYDGLTVPLFPPAAATLYTPTEVETAIASGLTPLNGVVNPFTRTVTGGVAKIERLVTTKTLQNALPFIVLRDFAVGRTGVYLAQQLDQAYADRWSADASPDGTLETDEVIDQIRDFIRAMMRELEAANILRNVDADLEKLVVERDAVPGRVNADISYTVVVGLHQIAFVHRVQV